MPKPRCHIYFDLETAEVTHDGPLDFPDRLTVKIGGKDEKRKWVNIKPYAIGAVIPNTEYGFKKFRYIREDDTNEDFREQVGFNPGRDGDLFLDFSERCVDNFIDLLYRLGREGNLFLTAYNVTYDYHMLLPELQRRFGDRLEIEATLGDNILLTAKLKISDPDHRRKIIINFVDLGIGHKALKLEKGIAQYIKGFKKIELNYAKKDIKYKNGLPYEFTDADTGEVKPFELEKEREYLRDDVIGLPVIHKNIKKQREIFYEVIVSHLNLFKGEKEHLINRGRTQSGYCKALCGTLIGKKYGFDEIGPSAFDRVFRPECSEEIYRMVRGSFIGGFTSGGAFKKGEGKTGEFGLVVDVNSMYPNIMFQKIPYGPLLTKYQIRTGGDYCEWLLIEGTESPTGKNKYSFFDNTILGGSFFERPGHKNGKNGIILREYFELMGEMCKHSFRVVDSFFQPYGFHLQEMMVRTFEEKKRNNAARNPVEAAKREAAKVAMNAMYGKTAENCHDNTEHGNQEEAAYEKEPLSEFKLGLSGIYVTTKSRIQLIRTIKDLVDSGCTFLYGDTDSIIFIPGNKDSGADLKLDDERLGYGAIEAVFNVFYYNGKRKKYILGNTLLDEIEKGTLTVKEALELIPEEIRDKGINEKNLKKKFKRKFALSGFDKRIAEKLTGNELRVLFNDETNVEVVRGKKKTMQDILTRKKAFGGTNADINPGKPKIGELHRDEKGTGRLIRNEN